MRNLVLLAVFALALAAGYLLWDGSEEPAPTGGGAAPSIEHTLARERAAAHFEKGDLERAREAIAPLVEVRAPALEDLVRAAAIEFGDRAESDPLPALERLRARDAENPSLHYMLARMSLESGEFERALLHYRRVLRGAPEDLPARVGLAATLADLGHTAEAEDLLRGVLEAGVDHGGPWYVQAVYRMWRLAQAADREAEQQQLGALHKQLRELGYGVPSPKELDQGTLAVVRPPRPHGTEAEEPGPPPTLEREPAILPELRGASELFACDLDGDGEVDLLAAGPRGVFCATRAGDGHRVEEVVSGPVQHVRAFDLGNDDSLDLLVCRGAELLLFEAASGADLLQLGGGPPSGDPPRRWSPSPLELPRLPGPPEDLVFGDFDHEGDLDLLAVGAFGARLLRNDGAAPRSDGRGGVSRGAFTDATAEAGLPVDVDLSWCSTEDFDGDQDVDLILGGPRAVYLMDSRRSGGFEDIAGAVFGGAVGMAREPIIADFDGDARPDLFEPGEPGTLWRQRADGTLKAQATGFAIPEGAAPFELDLDLDGTLDVLWPSEDGLAEGTLAFGLSIERPVAIAAGSGPGGPIAFADLDRDLDLDLVRVAEGGVEVFRCGGPVGRAARFRPLGLKDNRRAVGAVIEVRTLGLYRRIYWRGDAQLVGCGPHDRIGVVRTTWPNGVVQTRLDVEPADQPFLDTPSGGLQQAEGLVGSCPFLYAWNGRTYEFISDVIGGTPLGLPMAPGVLVPPDHDEYVLVRGDQLRPRRGLLEVQFTEELREVTYLDRIRLDAVDHPAEVEIQPNERFCFPPFPEAHVHSIRAPLSPISAIGSRGEDWTEALAVEDDVHAVPFEPLEPQFLGLAGPHWLELAFDPERVRDAEKLRLVCTGWFYWSDASVNMASARTPGVEFVPPILQVPGEDGEWVAVGPPVGFPSGKSKTMVIDVGGFLDREDPRLRIFTTLRLYWDRIQLAVDADDAPLRVTSLEPASAELWGRGFSGRIETGRSDLPERFDWDVLAEHQRWNQHPGLYTRYGETSALLSEIDDRFVIMGCGDALAVRFAAKELPPLEEGWARDWLVFLDGWAKDRDPNTVQALEVEPLPFHGMSGYPYRADEGFPDDEEHRAWRAEWNTREARSWIPPLAPIRESEWALRAARVR